MRNNAFRRVLAVSAAILAAGFIAASAPPATAATATRVVVPALSGYGYDNTDPIATGCSADATTMKTKNILDKWGSVVGRIELRYSINCHTAWGRVTNYYNHVQNDAHAATADLFRSDGASVNECYVPVGVNQSCYTKVKSSVVVYGF